MDPVAIVLDDRQRGQSDKQRADYKIWEFPLFLLSTPFLANNKSSWQEIGLIIK